MTVRTLAISSLIISLSSACHRRDRDEDPNTGNNTPEVPDTGCEPTETDSDDSADDTGNPVVEDSDEPVDTDTDTQTETDSGTSVELGAGLYAVVLGDEGTTLYAVTTDGGVLTFTEAATSPVDALWGVPQGGEKLGLFGRDTQEGEYVLTTIGGDTLSTEEYLSVVFSATGVAYGLNRDLGLELMNAVDDSTALALSDFGSLQNAWNQQGWFYTLMEVEDTFQVYDINLDAGTTTVVYTGPLEWSYTFSFGEAYYGVIETEEGLWSVQPLNGSEPITTFEADAPGDLVVSSEGTMYFTDGELLSTLDLASGGRVDYSLDDAPGNILGLVIQ